jgi:tetratricopeptide (TPR) repeat protein
MPLARPRLLLILPLLLLAAGCDRDPKVARQKFLDKGNDYFKRDKYKEASIMYRRALQRDLRFGEAWYRLGLTNMRLGLLGEAHRDFVRATELDPNNLDASVQLANILVDAYHSDPRSYHRLEADVRDVVAALRKRDPDNYDAHRLDGTLAAVDRDYPLAIAELKKASDLKPGSPEVTYLLMQSLVASGQPEEAEKYGLRLVAVKKDAGAIYDKLEEIYLRSNRLDRAEDTLKQKVANIPDGINLVELARFYYLTKRPADATATLNRLIGDHKKYPDGHLLAGDYYASIREFDSAIQQYEQGEKADPKNRRVYLKRKAAGLADSGKTAEAAALVAKLLKEDPNDAEAAAIHASLVMQMGADKEQIKAVISELQPLVNKMSNKPQLHYNLGRAYELQGDTAGLEQARLQFEETLKLDPSNLPARLDLAWLHLKRRDGASAVQVADEVLRRNPNSMAGMLIKGFGYLRIGEPDKAQSEFQATLKSFPGSNDAHYGLAMTAIQQKRFDYAEKEFESLRKGGDARGTDGLVSMRLAQHRYDEALKLVNDELQRKPDQVAVDRLAGILYEGRRWKEAAAEYQKAVAKEPANVRFWILLGQAKERSGDSEGALEAYSKAHKLAPNQVDAAMLIGHLYDTLNRPAEALKIYQDVLKLEPNDPYALNNIAFHQAEEGLDLNQALIYAQRAQQQKPEEIDFQDTAALIYLKKNLTDEGLRILQGVVTREPNRALYRLHLAMAYYQKGNKPAARKELEAAGKSNPTSLEQTRIRELLGKVG